MNLISLVELLLKIENINQEVLTDSVKELFKNYPTRKLQIVYGIDCQLDLIKLEYYHGRRIREYNVYQRIKD